MSAPSNISVVVTATPGAITMDGSGVRSRLTIADDSHHVEASAYGAGAGARLDAKTVSIQTIGGDFMAAAMFWRALANTAADVADEMMVSLACEGGEGA